jgi:NADPH:quinone reductase
VPTSEARMSGSARPADGLVPGADGVGVVEAVGEGVDCAQGVKPGARVIFNPSPGAWAERLTTRAELVWPIQDDLPDAIAAQLLPNTVIALLLLRAAAAGGAGRQA